MRSPWLVVALAACTGSDDAAKFVGTWSYYNATVATSCDNGAPTMQSLVGTIELSRAGDHAIAIDLASQETLAVAVSGTCRPTFTITSGEAYLVPQDSCDLVALDGTRMTLDYIQYTFTLADVTGPGIAPMTPGLDMLLEARLASPNGTCTIDAQPTLIAAN